ncbi:MAG: sensor histidine kinase [Bacteroidota bacterium]
MRKDKPTYMELLKEVAELRKRLSDLEASLTENKGQSDQLKTRFLTLVSHEIRTPLNAILGFSNLMVDKNLPYDKRQEYFEHIHHNSDNLLNLVDSMIDVSLLEAKKLTIKKEKFHLHNLLHQIYSYYSIEKHKMGKAHLVILLHKGLPDQDFFIYSDPYRLKQVLSQFLHNALKFTSRGIIEFGYQLQAGEGKIQFFIKDSGKGTIFDKFEKLEKNGNIAGGVGLGLTLAKGLIELLGGNVEFETNLTHGTTFHFTIDYLHQGVDASNLTLKLDEVLV